MLCSKRAILAETMMYFQVGTYFAAKEDETNQRPLIRVHRSVAAEMLIAVGIYISVCPQCQSQKVRLSRHATIFNTSDFTTRAKQLSTTMCHVIRLTFDCGHQTEQKELCQPPCNTKSGWDQHKPGKCREFESASSMNGIEDVR